MTTMKIYWYKPLVYNGIKLGRLTLSFSFVHIAPTNFSNYRAMLIKYLQDWSPRNRSLLLPNALVVRCDIQSRSSKPKVIEHVLYLPNMKTKKVPSDAIFVERPFYSLN